MRSAAPRLEHVQRRHAWTAPAVGHRAAHADAERDPLLTDPDGVRAACAFCAIIRGELTAEIVYADDLCLAILDHRPLFHGHVLLMPREHVTTFAELPASDVGPYMIVGQRLERAVEAAMHSDGSLMLVNNVVSQSVPHLHLHVIPRKFKDGLRFWLGPRVKYGGEVSIGDTARRIREAMSGTGLNG